MVQILSLLAFLGWLTYIVIAVADFAMKSPGQDIRSDMIIIFVGALLNLILWLIDVTPTGSSGGSTPGDSSFDVGDCGGGGDGGGGGD